MTSCVFNDHTYSFRHSPSLSSPLLSLSSSFIPQSSLLLSPFVSLLSFCVEEILSQRKRISFDSLFLVHVQKRLASLLFSASLSSLLTSASWQSMKRVVVETHDRLSKDIILNSRWFKNYKSSTTIRLGRIHRDHDWLLSKELTRSNLSLIKVFKRGICYIINENCTNIWEKMILGFWNFLEKKSQKSKSNYWLWPYFDFMWNQRRKRWDNITKIIFLENREKEDNFDIKIMRFRAQLDLLWFFEVNR